MRTTDKRPPSFMRGTPIVEAVGYTAFDVQLRMSEVGTVFYAITGERDPAPTLPELLNGTQEVPPGRKLTAQVRTGRPNREYIVSTREPLYLLDCTSRFMCLAL